MIKIIDKEIIKISKKNKSQHAIIIVLFKGKLPKYCAPMARNPNPGTNIPLDNDLSKIYFSALKKNPSVKDGAILIQLGIRPQLSMLKGFSYRIFPPSSKTLPLENNKGSGYNSSLNFSVVKRVICVYFVNKNGVIKFVNGKKYKKI